jgi:poly(A) polymerase/tRNA nucleotidyltransferase (CCA-adding enzyme)
MHMFHYDHEWSDSAVRRFVRTVGLEHLDDLFSTRAADTLGNGLRRGGESSELNELKVRITEIRAREEALSVRDLAIDGRDLIAQLALAEGPAIGRILDALLEVVLEDPACNEREELLRRARAIAPEMVSRHPGRGAKGGS